MLLRKQVSGQNWQQQVCKIVLDGLPGGGLLTGEIYRKEKGWESQAFCPAAHPFYVERFILCRLPAKTATCAIFGGHSVT